jgi:hypothetical protein
LSNHTRNDSHRIPESAKSATPQRTNRVPPAALRLSRREGFLTRTDLSALGLERRAVDAVFRALPVVVLPGYARPLIRTADYLDLIEDSTFNDDRVRLRPSGRAASGLREPFDTKRRQS